jgi:hypothetical protein
MEERHLREKDNGYPMFVAKVPSGMGFFDITVERHFFLRYDDIFSMLNSHPLHYTFICQYSLNMAMQIIRNKTPWHHDSRHLLHACQQLGQRWGPASRE